MTAHIPPWPPHLPIAVFAGLARSFITHRPRSVRADAEQFVSQFESYPHVTGLEWLPSTGPVCLAANHYERRDLWIGWAGAAITWSVAQLRGDDPPVHWLVMDELWLPIGSRRRRVPLTRPLFQGVAQAWGMVPFSTDSSAAGGRAIAVRHLLKLLGEAQVVGFFPEGAEGRAGLPGAERPGTVRLLQRLVRRRVPVVPVAVRERGASFAVAFGPPLDLERGGDVMNAIRMLYVQLGTSGVGPSIPVVSK